MEWPMVPLHKIISLEYGAALPANLRAVGGSIPVAGSNGISGYHDKALVAGPGIVVGRKGSAGKVVWFETDFWPIDTTYYVQPKVSGEMRFIYYLLSYLNLEKFATSTGVPGLNRNDAYKQQVPLVGPSEQRCIIEILDQADQLRKLHAEADKKTERILPALFNRMFGDPVTNPMGWPEMPLRQVIDRVEAGWSAVSEPRECTKDEFGVLKVSAVTSGRFLACEHKAVLELQTGRELISPRRGDLLFSRANTRELVAASCVVEDDYPNLFLPDKLWRLILHPERATAMYLKELFWNNGFRDRFRASASGSSGSMLNISQEPMLNTLAPIPPFTLQKEFSDKAWSLADITKEQRISEDVLDTLRSNLLQRAFSGALTASWREAHMKELLVEMEQQAKYLNTN